MKYLQPNRLAGLIWLILALLLAACGDSAPAATVPVNSVAGASKTAPPVKAAVGYSAPDFTAQTVTGETIKLSQLRGKAVIVNFWATF